MAKEFQNFSVKGVFGYSVSIINPNDNFSHLFFHVIQTVKPYTSDLRYDCQNFQPVAGLTSASP